MKTVLSYTKRFLAVLLALALVVLAVPDTALLAAQTGDDPVVTDDGSTGDTGDVGTDGTTADPDDLGDIQIVSDVHGAAENAYTLTFAGDDHATIQYSTTLTEGALDTPQSLTDHATASSSADHTYFTVTPAEGYLVKSVVVSGEAATNGAVAGPANGVYTYTPAATGNASAVTINVTYAAYSLTFANEKNATIQTTVFTGDAPAVDAEYTTYTSSPITALRPEKIAVKLSGAGLENLAATLTTDADGKYTMTKPQGKDYYVIQCTAPGDAENTPATDNAIAATVTADVETFAVTVSGNNVGYTLSPAGDLPDIIYGQNGSPLTVTAASGYEISSVKAYAVTDGNGDFQARTEIDIHINDGDVTAGGSQTFKGAGLANTVYITSGTVETAYSTATAQGKQLSFHYDIVATEAGSTVTPKIDGSAVTIDSEDNGATVTYGKDYSVTVAPKLGYRVTGATLYLNGVGNDEYAVELSGGALAANTAKQQFTADAEDIREIMYAIYSANASVDAYLVVSTEKLATVSFANVAGIKITTNAANIDSYNNSTARADVVRISEATGEKAATDLINRTIYVDASADLTFVISAATGEYLRDPEDAKQILTSISPALSGEHPYSAVKNQDGTYTVTIPKENFTTLPSEDDGSAGTGSITALTVTPAAVADTYTIVFDATLGSKYTAKINGSDAANNTKVLKDRAFTFTITPKDGYQVTTPVSDIKVTTEADGAGTNVVKSNQTPASPAVGEAVTFTMTKNVLDAASWTDSKIYITVTTAERSFTVTNEMGDEVTAKDSAGTGDIGTTATKDTPFAFTATVGSGKIISDLYATVEGSDTHIEAEWGGSYYTIPGADITGNLTLHATVATVTAPESASAIGHTTTWTPADLTTYHFGDPLVYAFAADAHYALSNGKLIATVTIDGAKSNIEADQASTNYTFAFIDFKGASAITLDPKVTEASYVITFDDKKGVDWVFDGTEPAGTAKYSEGYSFSVKATEGKTISAVKIYTNDGMTSEWTSSNYTVTPSSGVYTVTIGEEKVTAPLWVKVTTAAETYTVTIKANAKVNDADGNPISADKDAGAATYKTAYPVPIKTASGELVKSAANIEYEIDYVTYQTKGGTIKTLKAKESDGTFEIPAADVTGPITITVYTKQIPVSYATGNVTWVASTASVNPDAVTRPATADQYVVLKAKANYALDSVSASIDGTTTKLSYVGTQKGAQFVNRYNDDEEVETPDGAPTVADGNDLYVLPKAKVTSSATAITYTAKTYTDTRAVVTVDETSQKSGDFYTFEVVDLPEVVYGEDYTFKFMYGTGFTCATAIPSSAVTDIELYLAQAQEEATTTVAPVATTKVTVTYDESASESSNGIYAIKATKDAINTAYEAIATYNTDKAEAKKATFAPILKIATTAASYVVTYETTSATNVDFYPSTAAAAYINEPYTFTAKLQDAEADTNLLTKLTAYNTTEYTASPRTATAIWSADVEKEKSGTPTSYTIPAGTITDDITIVASTPAITMDNQVVLSNSDANKAISKLEYEDSTRLVSLEPLTYAWNTVKTSETISGLTTGAVFNFRVTMSKTAKFEPIVTVNAGGIETLEPASDEVSGSNRIYTYAVRVSSASTNVTVATNPTYTVTLKDGGLGAFDGTSAKYGYEGAESAATAYDAKNLPTVAAGKSIYFKLTLKEGYSVPETKGVTATNGTVQAYWQDETSLYIELASPTANATLTVNAAYDNTRYIEVTNQAAHVKSFTVSADAGVMNAAYLDKLSKDTKKSMKGVVKDGNGYDALMANDTIYAGANGSYFVITGKVSEKGYIPTVAFYTDSTDSSAAEVYTAEDNNADAVTITKEAEKTDFTIKINGAMFASNGVSVYNIVLGEEKVPAGLIEVVMADGSAYDIDAVLDVATMASVDGVYLEPGATESAVTTSGYGFDAGYLGAKVALTITPKAHFTITGVTAGDKKVTSKPEGCTVTATTTAAVQTYKVSVAPMIEVQPILYGGDEVDKNAAVKGKTATAVKDGVKTVTYNYTGSGNLLQGGRDYALDVLVGGEKATSFDIEVLPANKKGTYDTTSSTGSGGSLTVTTGANETLTINLTNINGDSALKADKAYQIKANAALTQINVNGAAKTGSEYTVSQEAGTVKTYKLTSGTTGVALDKDRLQVNVYTDASKTAELDTVTAAITSDAKNNLYLVVSTLGTDSGYLTLSYSGDDIEYTELAINHKDNKLLKLDTQAAAVTAASTKNQKATVRQTSASDVSVTLSLGLPAQVASSLASISNGAVYWKITLTPNNTKTAEVNPALGTASDTYDQVVAYVKADAKTVTATIPALVVGGTNVATEEGEAVAFDISTELVQLAGAVTETTTPASECTWITDVTGDVTIDAGKVFFSELATKTAATGKYNFGTKAVAYPTRLAARAVNGTLYLGQDYTGLGALAAKNYTADGDLILANLTPTGGTVTKDLNYEIADVTPSKIQDSGSNTISFNSLQNGGAAYQGADANDYNIDVEVKNGQLVIPAGSVAKLGRLTMKAKSGAYQIQVTAPRAAGGQEVSAIVKVALQQRATATNVTLDQTTLFKTKTAGKALNITLKPVAIATYTGFVTPTQTQYSWTATADEDYGKALLDYVTVANGRVTVKANYSFPNEVNSVTFKVTATSKLNAAATFTSTITLKSTETQLGELILGKAGVGSIEIIAKNGQSVTPAEINATSLNNTTYGTDTGIRFYILKKGAPVRAAGETIDDKWVVDVDAAHAASGSYDTAVSYKSSNTKTAAVIGGLTPDAAPYGISATGTAGTVNFTATAEDSGKSVKMTLKVGNVAMANSKTEKDYLVLMLKGDPTEITGGSKTNLTVKTVAAGYFNPTNVADKDAKTAGHTYALPVANDTGKLILQAALVHWDSLTGYTGPTEISAGYAQTFRAGKGAKLIADGTDVTTGTYTIAMQANTATVTLNNVTYTLTNTAYNNVVDTKSKTTISHVLDVASNGLAVDSRNTGKRTSLNAAQDHMYQSIAFVKGKGDTDGLIDKAVITADQTDPASVSFVTTYLAADGSYEVNSLGVDTNGQKAFTVKTLTNTPAITAGTYKLYVTYLNGTTPLTAPQEVTLTAKNLAAFTPTTSYTIDFSSTASNQIFALFGKRAGYTNPTAKILQITNLNTNGVENDFRGLFDSTTLDALNGTWANGVDAISFVENAALLQKINSNNGSGYITYTADGGVTEKTVKVTFKATANVDTYYNLLRAEVQKLASRANSDFMPEELGNDPAKYAEALSESMAKRIGIYGNSDYSITASGVQYDAVANTVSVGAYILSSLSKGNVVATRLYSDPPKILVHSMDSITITKTGVTGVNYTVSGGTQVTMSGDSESLFTDTAKSSQTVYAGQTVALAVTTSDLSGKRVVATVTNGTGPAVTVLTSANNTNWTGTVTITSTTSSIAISVEDATAVNPAVTLKGSPSSIAALGTVADNVKYAINDGDFAAYRDSGVKAYSGDTFKLQLPTVNEKDYAFAVTYTTAGSTKRVSGTYDEESYTTVYDIPVSAAAITVNIAVTTAPHSVVIVNEAGAAITELSKTGVQEVADGADLSFTYKVTDGYKVTVAPAGVTTGDAVKTYTLSNITESQTVTITAVPTLTLTMTGATGDIKYAATEEGAASGTNYSAPIDTIKGADVYFKVPVTVAGETPAAGEYAVEVTGAEPTATSGVYKVAASETPVNVTITATKYVTLAAAKAGLDAKITEVKLDGTEGLSKVVTKGSNVTLSFKYPVGYTVTPTASTTALTEEELASKTESTSEGVTTATYTVGALDDTRTVTLTAAKTTSSIALVRNATQVASVSYKKNGGDPVNVSFTGNNATIADVATEDVLVFTVTPQSGWAATVSTTDAAGMHEVSAEADGTFKVTMDGANRVTKINFNGVDADANAKQLTIAKGENITTVKNGEIDVTAEAQTFKPNVKQTLTITTAADYVPAEFTLTGYTVSKPKKSGENTYTVDVTLTDWDNENLATNVTIEAVALHAVTLTTGANVAAITAYDYFNAGAAVSSGYKTATGYPTLITATLTAGDIGTANGEYTLYATYTPSGGSATTVAAELVADIEDEKIDKTVAKDVTTKSAFLLPAGVTAATVAAVKNVNFTFTNNATTVSEAKVASFYEEDGTTPLTTKAVEVGKTMTFKVLCDEKYTPVFKDGNSDVLAATSKSESATNHKFTYTYTSAAQTDPGITYTLETTADTTVAGLASYSGAITAAKLYEADGTTVVAASLTDTPVAILKGSEYKLALTVAKGYEVQTAVPVFTKSSSVVDKMTATALTAEQKAAANTLANMLEADGRTVVYTIKATETGEYAMTLAGVATQKTVSVSTDNTNDTAGLASLTYHPDDADVTFIGVNNATANLGETFTVKATMSSGYYLPAGSVEVAGESTATYTPEESSAAAENVRSAVTITVNVLDTEAAVITVTPVAAAYATTVTNGDATHVTDLKVKVGEEYLALSEEEVTTYLASTKFDDTVSLQATVAAGYNLSAASAGNTVNITQGNVNASRTVSFTVKIAKAAAAAITVGATQKTTLVKTNAAPDGYTATIGGETLNETGVEKPLGEVTIVINALNDKTLTGLTIGGTAVNPGTPVKEETTSTYTITYDITDVSRDELVVQPTLSE